MPDGTSGHVSNLNIQGVVKGIIGNSSSSLTSMVMNIFIDGTSAQTDQIVGYANNSIVGQAAYNWRLPTGIEQYFLREITDQIVPSSFKGPPLMDNLRLEMTSIRPTLNDVISLFIESRVVRS
jgi:hypothetical protein